MIYIGLYLYYSEFFISLYLPFNLYNKLKLSIHVKKQLSIHIIQSPHQLQKGLSLCLTSYPSNFLLNISSNLILNLIWFKIYC